MLQKYDTLKSSLLLAFAAVGGVAFAPAAMADVTCSASDGYGETVASYVAEAKSCISSATTLNADFADEIAELMNKDRIAAGLKPMTRRASLDTAAQAHALDMAARGYADHVDKEGRDHLYRMRAFDRTMLAGATGANVLVTGAGSDANDIYVLMLEDDYNAENLVREGFSHFGLALSTTDGQSHVVMVFAALEGELKQDMPLTLVETTPVRAILNASGSETLGWGLSDARTGEVLEKGMNTRVRAANLQTTASAALDLVVSASTDTMVLKGPLVTIR